MGKERIYYLLHSTFKVVIPPGKEKTTEHHSKLVEK